MIYNKIFKVNSKTLRDVVNKLSKWKTRHYEEIRAIFKQPLIDTLKDILDKLSLSWYLSPLIKSFTIKKIHDNDITLNDGCF